MQADPSLSGIALVVQQSISGAIDLSAAATASLTAADSIFDGTGSRLPTLHAPQASLTRVTVLGGTQVGALSETIDTLFCAPVNAAAGPLGGVRYSYLPEGSQVPQPYRCQPAMTLSVPGTDLAQTRILLVPWFVSRRYGTPGYGQLDTRCHTVIRNGASVEGELGAMHALQHAQREGNLIDCQAEYLRFGITLNLFPVT